MPIDLEDCIVAVASPPGAAARGIIRLSGTNIREVVAAVFQSRDSEASWQVARLPRRTPGFLNLPRVGLPVPAALYFWPTRRSYTGQPMAELHLIGAMPLLDAALETLCERGARPAERGEFTMRAFLSGRVDLVQAEAVVGVIDATSHQELQTALQQLGGAVTSRLSGTRQALLELLGDLEAGLDFVEEDIEFITAEEVHLRLTNAQSVLETLSRDADDRLPSGHLPRVVLTGLPNAGKSTLFNL
ncbi:MAG: hypothetical protein KDA96_20295, partial [Planctomycetaceae bacterium]|nr:hypothetical protein [Planctomycetaceae bacterium]